MALRISSVSIDRTLWALVAYFRILQKLSLFPEQVAESYIMSHIVALILVNAQHFNVGHIYVQNELFVRLHRFIREFNIDFQDNARRKRPIHTDFRGYVRLSYYLHQITACINRFLPNVNHS